MRRGALGCLALTHIKVSLLVAAFVPCPCMHSRFHAAVSARGILKPNQPDASVSFDNDLHKLVSTSPESRSPEFLLAPFPKFSEQLHCGAQPQCQWSSKLCAGTKHVTASPARTNLLCAEVTANCWGCKRPGCR